VLGPAFPYAPDPILWYTRKGDTVEVTPIWYADSGGREGYTDPTRTDITRYRDGTLVGDAPDAGFGEFTVPGDAGDYRLAITAERTGADELSTSDSTVWTFRSSHVDGTQWQPVPLSVVRFTPALDAHNTAPAGTAFPVPVTVTGQPGRPPARSPR
jgi:hypothetical protein